MSTPANIPLALKAFMESGVSVIAATRDAANAPAIVRAGGCRVTDDGHVTIFVAAEQAARNLENVRSTGSIAVVYLMPHGYECYQVKGAGAHVVPLDAADRECIAAYRSAFFANLFAIAVPETVAAGLLPSAPEAFVGLTFTPAEIFCNTPGPAVGNLSRESGA